jgi:hypothetical protein
LFKLKGTMNMYGPTLPLTGTGVLLGGVLFDQAALVGVAVSAILFGAVLIRLSFRRNRAATEV